MNKKIMICIVAIIMLGLMIVEISGMTNATVVQLNYKKITICVGKTKQLKMKGTKKRVKWSSSNKKIATVSNTGKVKAKKKGSVVIVAKIAKKKYKCTVTIKNNKSAVHEKATEETRVFEQSTEETKMSERTSEEAKENKMKVTIGNTVLTATLFDNKATQKLKELMRNGGLTIQFSMYGGFEQVGSIGTSLPTNDVQTTTKSGDIMLYSGNQMVLFYGKNSWSYTRLGQFDDASIAKLKDVLGNGDVTATFTLY